ncbi:hypothetical protein PoB_006664300 [Plakobranchus ocellatus]|uniref:Uncharacterized protein n=1 Tax=Plakobranchus ocellatus TaxID=259542 RepID=A0AAV4D7E1_9GAST|nr:hypothetical protein PoB_006664300 [Plakobranchus ocellatus]
MTFDTGEVHSPSSVLKIWSPPGAENVWKFFACAGSSMTYSFPGGSNTHTNGIYSHKGSRTCNDRVSFDPQASTFVTVLQAIIRMIPVLPGHLSSSSNLRD